MFLRKVVLEMVFQNEFLHLSYLSTITPRCRWELVQDISDLFR